MFSLNYELIEHFPVPEEFHALSTHIDDSTKQISVVLV